MMKAILLAAVAALALTACSQTEKGAATGAAAGAVAGALITGDVRGAAVGAVVGGTAGALIGSVEDEQGMCWYQDRRTGERYKDYCPT